MQALILEQQDGKTISSVQTIDADQLPPGDVTVDIHWSSLNYKDALAITGKGKIIRNFPMIPGIDLVSEVGVVDDHVTQPGRRQPFQVPGDQPLAADRKQGFGRVVCERAHALAATGGENHPCRLSPRPLFRKRG